MYEDSVSGEDKKESSREAECLLNQSGAVGFLCRGNYKNQVSRERRKRINK